MLDEDLSLETDPNKEKLRKLYSRVKKFFEVQLTFSKKTLNESLLLLEDIGFIGIEIYPNPYREGCVYVTCFKGKHGPCYDVEISVEYKGPFNAVMDDDQHLYIKGDKVPVCEKTYLILKQKTYEKSFIFYDDEYLKNNENESKKLFDCDTLEEATEKILKSVKVIDESVVNVDKEYLYIGPYFLAILENGEVLRRGYVNMISVRQIEVLPSTITIQNLKKLKLNKISKEMIYNKDTLSLKKNERIVLDADTFNLDVLKSISETLKKKLLDAITKEKDYFVITGSDPADEYGCCPSELVSEAFFLNRNGVLSYLKDASSNGVCPIHCFAFHNEITLNSLSEPVYKLNENFRKSVKKRLSQKNLFLNIFKIILILFCFFTITFAIVTRIKSSSYESYDFDDILVNSNEKQVFILFYQTKKCEQCVNMEKFTQNMIKNKSLNIKLKLLNMDHPKYNEIIDSYGLFSSTLFIANKRSKKYEIVLIKEAWEYYRDEEAFVTMLQEHIKE